MCVVGANFRFSFPQEYEMKQEGKYIVRIFSSSDDRTSVWIEKSLNENDEYDLDRIVADGEGIIVVMVRTESAPAILDRSSLVRWVVGRYKAEVQGRPLDNVHRRTLDETWRQFYRYLTGKELAYPTHDEMLARREHERDKE